MGDIQLTLNGGAGEYVQWYTDSSCTNSVGIGNPLTISSPLVTTTYYGRWESSQGCSSSPQNVTVNVLTPAVFMVLPASSPGWSNSSSLANPNSVYIGGLTDDGNWVLLTISNAPVAVYIPDISVTIPYSYANFASGRGIANYGSQLLVCGNTPNDNKRALAADISVTNLTIRGSVNTIQLSNYNCVSLNSETGTGYAVGRKTGIPTKGIAWEIAVPGTFPLTDGTQIVGINSTEFTSVSYNGMAGGHDQRGDLSANYPIVFNCITSIITPVPFWPIPPGTPANSSGLGWGISYSGLYSCGIFNNLIGTTDLGHGFRYNISAGTTQELFPVGGDIVGVQQQSSGIDVGDNGTVVGYSLNSTFTPTTQAAIWRGSNTSGELLQNVLSACCIDIADYGFDYLERCVSITYDSRVIAGRGHLVGFPSNQYRGFVVTFPQPLTSTYPSPGIL